jgi:LmbE family N-acetylglucosaminyl deacetylase
MLNAIGLVYNGRMQKHIYLSPHLDDAVFSCGGLIFQQTKRGDDVFIVTICAGQPPVGGLSKFGEELHSRWEGTESPIQSRRREDREACNRLGVSHVHLEILDSVYRKDEEGWHLYPTEESIFGPLASSEGALVEIVAAQISDSFRTGAHLYVPLCFGGHVDHRLTRLATETLGSQLSYYRDLPYAARGFHIPDDLGLPSGEEVFHTLETDEIETWTNAIMEYKSQISTFWPNKDSLTSEIDLILQEWGGIPILRTDQPV